MHRYKKTLCLSATADKKMPLPHRKLSSADFCLDQSSTLSALQVLSPYF